MVTYHYCTVQIITTHTHTRTSVSHLQRTGSVWKSCEAVTKLSKENRSAVLKAFISQLHLLKDACSEVLEASVVAF